MWLDSRRDGGLGAEPPGAAPAALSNAAVVVTSLGMLLGFSALAVDVSMIHLADVQLQLAVDSAALSGAQALNGTAAGVNSAVAITRDIASRNAVLGRPLVLKTSEVEVGKYDAKTKVFTTWTAGDPWEVNAVRVNARPAAISSGLGEVAFGVRSYNIQASAMGQRLWGMYPAAGSPCYLPFAVPDCNLDVTPVGSNPPPTEFTFASNSTIAWGNPDANPSASWTRNHLLNMCGDTPLSMGNTMYGNTGQLASALHTTGTIMNDLTAISPTTWDTALYGTQPPRDNGSVIHPSNWTNVYEGPVALIDAGTNCAAPNLNGILRITGVAWGVLYDVANTGSDKALFFQLDIKKKHDIWAKPDMNAKSRNVFAPGPPSLVY